MHGKWSRAVSFGLALAISCYGLPSFAQDAEAENQPVASSRDSNESSTDLPESPGAVKAQSNSGAQGNSTGSPQSSQQSQPTGTAVAPSVQTSGGAASKPAGVAIAPPKQRQTRSWLIKFGFIAGAGAALGTVFALSAASPGRVPGSGR